MNKTDLINALVFKTEGITKQDISTIVEGLLNEVTETLATGEKIAIQGFGNFSVKDTAARKGRNPSSGAEIDIPAGRKVSFKASDSLKEIVNP